MYLNTENPNSHIDQIVYMDNDPDEIGQIISVEEIVNEIKIFFNVKHINGRVYKVSNFDLKDFNALISITETKLQNYKDLKTMFEN